MMNTKRSQAFSADVIIVVIIILFGTLFLVISQIGVLEKDVLVDKRYEEASLQAKLVVDGLRDSEVIDDENQIDVERLVGLNEEEFKERYNVGGDFAIVFEKDGKLVKIDPDHGVNCVGSESIMINGESCK